jgi:hypothetical protein
LDSAITRDLTPDQYPLKAIKLSNFEDAIKDHKKGTIIRFDGVKGGIKNKLSQIQKVIALYFRFSLLDKNFSVFIDGQKVTHKDLADLAEKT